MPHIIVEHDNPKGIDVAQLLRAMHKEAMTIDAFPVGGLRVRAHQCERSRVADGGSEYGFIYVYVRIGEGRSDATKDEIGERLFSVLCAQTKSSFDREIGLSLGLEIQEISKELTWKKNNLHDLIK